MSSDVLCNSIDDCGDLSDEMNPLCDVTMPPPTTPQGIDQQCLINYSLLIYLPKNVLIDCLHISTMHLHWGPVYKYYNSDTNCADLTGCAFVQGLK